MIRIRAVLLSSAALFLILVNPAFASGSYFSENIPKADLQVERTYGASEKITNQLGLIKKELERIVEKKDIPWEALVAFGIGLAGIFGLHEVVKNLLYKPKIEVGIKQEPPDCLKIAMTNTATGQFLYDTYYLRFKIENTGNQKMEDVEVVALELYKKRANNRFAKVGSFLPMNLVWANVHEVTMPKIQPGLFKHCDFGHLIQNPNPYVNLNAFGLAGRSNVIFILETQVTPNTGSNYLLPGKYKIKLAFAANNLRPKLYWYKFEIKNRWDTNEQRMLSRNVLVEKISS